MPNVSVVADSHRGRTYARYKAPHVLNQKECFQQAAPLPGYYDQPEYGCSTNCTEGCVHRQPSIYNPGPSFANSTHSVDLIRVHKATVHFTCVRVLMVLKRERLNDYNAHVTERHTYALARVLMKPAPGHAFNNKAVFRNNIIAGNYTRVPTGVWKEWQTGTVGLRTMDITPAISEPSPATLQFVGVTQEIFRTMTGQMECWNASCLDQEDCLPLCA